MATLTHSVGARLPRDLEGDLELRGLRHAKVVPTPGSDKGWTLRGSGFGRGNYKLSYRDANGDRIRVLRFPGYRLLLELDNNRALRVDVTDIPSGQPIGMSALVRFLDHVRYLNRWGSTVRCRLVVTRNGVDLSYSNNVNANTPVKPWEQPLDPDLLTRDAGIRYCGDLTKTTRKFYGRSLRLIGGRRYFTFKGALETDPALRGFACIGLVGNLYEVRADEDEKPYSGGDHMAWTLGGSSFAWDDRPKKGIFKEKDIDFSTEEYEFESESAYVRMGRGMLLKFLETPQGQSGTYLIWIAGHAGLIKNGVLYECKPSGKGFTKETFVEASESAVRKFDLAAMKLQLKKNKYNLSSLA